MQRIVYLPIKQRARIQGKIAILPKIQQMVDGKTVKVRQILRKLEMAMARQRTADLRSLRLKQESWETRLQGSRMMSMTSNQSMTLRNMRVGIHDLSRAYMILWVRRVVVVTLHCTGPIYECRFRRVSAHEV